MVSIDTAVELSGLPGMHGRTKPQDANCKAVPVGVKGKVNSWNGCTVASRRRCKMLPVVGMVQM